MHRTIIKFKDVKKSFGRCIILDNISFEVESGDIFGIIGPSGSGKTTLLKTLIGYWRPDQGEVLFRFPGDRFIEVQSNTEEIKKIFGYAAQMPSFYPELTVQENLRYFGSLYSLPRDMIKNNISTLLGLVELDGSEKQLSKNLSGGMQRRLDIACAMIHDPKILIMDEPTSDLDPMLAKQIWNLILKINSKGTTIIVASHHIKEMENLCTTIAIILNGKIEMVGSVPQLIAHISKGQEISIETYPGNYDRIIKSFKDPLIMSVENRGHELVMRTQKPETVLNKLLHHLSATKETLIDVKIDKLSLDDVFSSLAKKKK